MKMLICSDGSEQADRAVRLGAQIAGACQAETTLLGIIEVKGGSESILESLRRGQALLQDKGVRAELITKQGNPIEEIVRRTAESPFDIVVIGAVRKESRGLFWLSSKAYKIVKEVEPPVLIVAGKSVSFKRGLICSGGKDYIDHAVRLTGTIAHAVGARVSLLHVIAEAPAIYSRLPKMQETAEHLLRSNSELGMNLRREKETLESLGVVTEVRLRQGLVLDEILNELREGAYDLVVTGSALSRGLRTYVLGDVSREVVNRAPCPILIVRSQEQAGDVHSGFRSFWERFSSHRRPGEQRQNDRRG